MPVACGDAGELLRLADLAGFRVFHLDAALMPDKKTLLEQMAQRLGFPGDFGKNWDAAIDYLSDLHSFHGGGKFLIIVEHAAQLQKNDPKLYGDFIKVLELGAGRTTEAFKDAVTLRIAVVD